MNLWAPEVLRHMTFESRREGICEWSRAQQNNNR